MFFFIHKEKLYDTENNFVMSIINITNFFFARRKIFFFSRKNNYSLNILTTARDNLFMVSILYPPSNM